MTDQRKNPEQARSRERVEAIISAAKRLIAARGSARFSMSELAKAAGISQSSMYRYFKDNTAVLQTLAERHSRESSARITQEILTAARGATIAEVCRRGLQAYFDAVRADPVQRYVKAALQANPSLEHLHVADARRQAELMRQLMQDNLGDAALGITIPDLALLFSYLAGAVGNLSGLVDDAEGRRLEDGFINIALGFLDLTK